MELRYFRKARNLTQAQVADVLGIPVKTYQNYEREVRDADSATLCALADFYGITLDQLYGRAEPEPSGKAAVIEAEQMEDELRGIFQTLTYDGRCLLLSIAREVEGYFGD